MAGKTTTKLLEELRKLGRGNINGFIDLVDQYFPDNDAKEVAMYVLGKLAQDEMRTMAVALGKESIELPIKMLQVTELFESQMTTNKFYKDYYHLISAVLASDRVQAEAFKTLIVEDKDVAKYICGARLSALIGVHHIYCNDVATSVEFATKLRKVMTPDENMKKFFG